MRFQLTALVYYNYFSAKPTCNCRTSLIMIPGTVYNVTREGAEMTKMTKKRASILLSDVPDDKRFYCADGRVLKNLSDLRSALNGMSVETFAHHSSEGRNDFANWVRDVIGDKTLARDLGKLLNRTEAAKRVASRVAFLSSKLS